MNMVNIGFRNAVSAEKIVAVVKPNTAPIRRMVSKAENDGMLIDATFGRKNRSVIFMDSGHVVLSAIQPDRITERCQKGITPVGCSVQEDESDDAEPEEISQK